jgi:hypothetical protein|tara:strand:+ start:446 stop:670 length:225 start_codon:yes stop_codon:yes gene_type:complete
MESRLNEIAKQFAKEVKGRPEGLTKREWFEQRFAIADQSFTQITGTKLDSKIWGLVLNMVVLDDLVLQTPEGEK